ncbi:MAG TPA: hypothetical protein VFD70_17875 [Anaerolineae bacterium]|nr:hypothetical protein [Anaerolineae bacterium]
MIRHTRSYPPEVRERARELRRAGWTYPEIIEKLGGDIPQPTLQGWVCDIELTTEQRARIKQKELEGSAKGRPFGALWNRLQKQKRLQEAKDQALPHAKRLAQDREALQLMAAALYIGEGAKSPGQFSFCNSDPEVIRGWVKLLRKSFDIDESKFRCQINISEGMDEDSLRRFWSKVTGIPLSQFIKGTVDRRPNKKRKEGYKGVCVVLYYSMYVRRYLDSLAAEVLEEIQSEPFES